MNIFICWSGNLSKAIAEEFRTSLPAALQFVKPYFSEVDINKGAKWLTELTVQLKDTGVGLVLLTRENLDSTWMMFEAGALSNSIEHSRVYPVVFEIEKTDIKGPLAAFQATKFEDEKEVLRLFSSINDAAKPNGLTDDVLKAAFSNWWPSLKAGVDAAIKAHAQTSFKPRRVRSERDLIEEILQLTRSLSDAATPSTKQALQVPFDYKRSLYGRIFATIEIIIEYWKPLMSNEDKVLVATEMSKLLEYASKGRYTDHLKTGVSNDIARLTAAVAIDDDDIPF